MAESLLAAQLAAWWNRLRGRYHPRPCPFSQARVLEMRGRGLVASPRRILEAFGLREGERALEIGPGIGYYSIEAARRLGLAGRLICLDLQPDMLYECRRRVEAAGLRADVVSADALRLPLRSASVDHVFLITVLGELPDRAAGLAEIRRVLRPGGSLSVSEQFPDPDFVTRGTLRRELGAAGFVEGSTRGLLWYTSTWRLPAQR